MLFRSPVLASTNAPVHTDIVTSLVLLALRIQFSIASVCPFCAGMTTIFGAGASANVYCGVILIPPSVTGWVL